jgi:hypothetical protein
MSILRNGQESAQELFTILPIPLHNFFTALRYTLASPVVLEFAILRDGLILDSTELAGFPLLVTLIIDRYQEPIGITGVQAKACALERTTRRVPFGESPHSRFFG